MRQSSDITLDNRLVISIGSNCEKKEKNVAEACLWLSTVLRDIKISAIYSTLPLKGNGENYANAVVSGFYTGKISELQERCKIYENDNGRTLEMRTKGIVPVDIDIVIIGDRIIRPKDYSAEYFRKGYEEIRGKEIS